MRTSSADQLRARARALRHLAARLADAAALTLHQRAGAETWIGPMATRCLEDLLAVRREVLGARDELIIAARALERQATEVETAAAVTGRVV